MEAKHEMPPLTISDDGLAKIKGLLVATIHDAVSERYHYWGQDVIRDSAEMQRAKAELRKQTAPLIAELKLYAETVEDKATRTRIDKEVLRLIKEL